MLQVYKLPGSSYEEITKIIRAYASISSKTVAVTLSELSQCSGIEKTIISRNNGFLVQIKLLSEGNKKAATDLCRELSRAYELKMRDKIYEVWSSIVEKDDFLNRMVSSVQIKREISKNDFINHIIYSSSNNNSNNTRAGASAIIEILKIACKIEEKDGKIRIVNNYNKRQSTVEREEKLEPVKAVTEVKSENYNSNICASEEGFYVQSYTCESGKLAKFIIPNGATEDDLLGFYDLLNIVLKRKFKVKIVE